MGIRVEWVPYGRAAADALRRVVGDAKGDDPLAPVTVVVPSNHVGVATRRPLASGTLGPVRSRGTGLAAVTFLTPTGWPSCSAPADWPPPAGARFPSR